jgi:aryl-alcohol dehydrogenase-like predicted oxidoreductase
MSDTNKPSLALGTAMWGWTVAPEAAFALLDAFYAAGGREVDGATNYPINKIPEDFRRAERILAEWAGAHGVTDLKVMMKVGSIDNLRSPEHNLSKSFLLICLDEYQALLGANLDTLMVHWDNRDSEADIAETLEALAIARQAGLRVGLSGIRHPERYARLNLDFGLDFRIQIKHNLLQSDYARYRDFHGSRRFIAYGLNAGGVKLRAEEYGPGASLAARGGNPGETPPLVHDLRQWLAALPNANRRPLPTAMNHLGMIYAWYHPDISTLLAGPSSAGQMQDTLNWAQHLGQYDYSDLYLQLRDLAQ